MENIILPFMRYADFSGRSRRLEYWSFALINAAVTIFLLFGFIYAFLESRDFSSLNNSSLNYLTIFVFWIAVTFIPHLAVTVRRLHDINLSGWFYLINLVPSIGSIILLIMLLKGGTNGPNMYGDDPKNPGGFWWEKDDGPPEGYPEPARATTNKIRSGTAQNNGLYSAGRSFGQARK